MEHTYALLVKKEYKDLIDNYIYEEYELKYISLVYDDIKNKMSFYKKQYDKALNNNFDGKGILISYDFKMLPLKGKYNWDQVQMIFNQLKEKIFSNPNKIK